MKIIGDEFDRNIKYRLYRNIKDLLHPTISKKNISSYRIIVKDDLVPLHVFYPKKVSNLNKVIIYIPSNGDVSGCKYKYSDICKDFAKNLDALVVAIDYFDDKNKFPKAIDNCLEMVKYLKSEFVNSCIDVNSIYLMGDTMGANLISAINIKDCNIGLSSIIISPAVSMEYFGESRFSSIKTNGSVDLLTVKRLASFIKKYALNEIDNKLVTILNNKSFKAFPKTLVITGGMDPLRDEGEEFYNRLVKDGVDCTYLNIDFATQGFIKNMDEEISYKFYNKIKEFIK